MKKYRFTKRHRTEVLGKIFPWFVFVIIGLLMLAGLASCSTTKVVEQVPVYVHDTVRDVREVHDSTYIDKWHTVIQDGDTVYITDTRVEYRERVKVDTVREVVERPVTVTQTETVEVEKPLGWWQTTFIWVGVLTLVALLVWVVFKLRKWLWKQ